MQFRKYLSEDSVFLNQEFRSLDEVLVFLSEQFALKTGLEAGSLHTLLVEREKLSSTWIGKETMLPHNRSSEVKDLHMIFIRCKEPFLLEDGNPVRFIFSILTSVTQEHLYLGILQGIAQLIQKESTFLNDCQSPAELFDLLGSSSSMMGAPLTAGDLAKPWPRVKKTDTLSTALDLMKQHDVFFLPVFSEADGTLCGVLDLVDLLKAGFPDYVFSLYDLSMIKDFQPVKYFWQNEKQLVIGDFIRDCKTYMILDEASYPEIFFMMIKGNRRHLLVLNNKDEFVGVIHPGEIINKMLRP